MKICIVIANYYPEISKNLTLGAEEVLEKFGLKNFKKIISPGIFEIPFIISKNIDSYDAFISLGCVIKGETPHFDFISSTTFNSIQSLSVKYKKPIGNGIITCLNKTQAEKRSNTKEKNKGGEAAKAVLSILEIANNDTKWSSSKS